MRTASCIMQQGLSPAAASTVKQAVALARRRGHGQVTPLHVANVMFASSAGLLRAACLRSHAHPLRCKALELCLNVSLNRLPAPCAAPHHLPSLSHALVAAFKRAQANQRRGSLEAQQPLLAVKIELEQLVVSILDDPSVSRVMREAGFCSTQVKSNVGIKAVSSDITISTAATPQAISKTKSSIDPAKNDDDDNVTSVVEALVVSRGSRNLVVVGERLDANDAVVRAVMDRVNKGEVPEVLSNAEFITLPLFSFRGMSREEVDHKVGELRCFLRSCCAGRGVVLYLGDLKWVADEYMPGCGEKGRSLFCPVEYVSMEIRSLVFDGNGGENSKGRFWLMGIATYQTYMRCKIGQPSLETLWGLQSLTIPACNLGLTLNWDSGLESQSKGKFTGDGPLHYSLVEDGCYANISNNYETEAQIFPITVAIASNLPPWLQQHEEESRRRTSSDDQSCRLLKDHYYQKGNSICSSAIQGQHKLSEMAFNFSSVFPCDYSSSSSISSYDQRTLSMHQNQQNWLLPLAIRNPCSHKSNPNSSTSNSTMEMEYVPKFNELNAENLKILCSALEKKVVSWQQETVLEIASTILQCRSGMMKRKEKSKSSFEIKEETWLFFQGTDSEGKKRIAKELASLIFCAPTNFVSISLSRISSSLPDHSMDYLCRKRCREEASHTYLERLFEVLNENPHRVIYLEDVDQADYHTQAGIKAGIERGKICNHSGDEVSLSDAVIILSCKSFKSGSRVCSPPVKQKTTAKGEDEKKESSDKNKVDMLLSLDLNLCTAAYDGLDDHSFDDAGLLDLVDRTFFLKLPEDF